MQNGLEEILRGEKPIVKWIYNPYKDRWFADPFILFTDKDYLTLLAEEFSYNLQRGRIAELIVSLETYEIVEMRIVLDLKTHLSFPAIMREGGRIFIYPENSASGKLNFYEYDVKNHSVNFVKEILERPLTDSILYKENNNNLYLLSTEIPTQNENILSVYLYNKDSQTYNKISDIAFEEKIARNAGNIFEYEGQLYRPAQECNLSYGHAVSIQLLKIDEKGVFNFSEKVRLFSPNKRYGQGFHTFNVYNNFIVVDAMAFRYYNLAIFIRRIVALVKKIFR